MSRHNALAQALLAYQNLSVRLADIDGHRSALSTDDPTHPTIFVHHTLSPAAIEREIDRHVQYLRDRDQRERRRGIEVCPELDSDEHGYDLAAGDGTEVAAWQRRRAFGVVPQM